MMDLKSQGKRRGSSGDWANKMLDEHSQTICCPRCNCNGVDLIGSDAAVNIYQCGFCRTRFEDSIHEDLDREPMAIFSKTICPHCNGSKTKVTHRAGGPQNIRYHLCNDCQLTFKSREV